MKTPRLLWYVALIACASVALALIVNTVHGQPLPPALNGVCGFPSTITPQTATHLASGAAYASFSVTNTAGGPTIPVMASGRGSIVGAMFFVVIAPINVTTDGTAPNSNQGGMIFGPSTAGGSSFVVCGSDLARLKWVAASATSGNSTVFGTFFTNGR